MDMALINNNLVETKLNSHLQFFFFFSDYCSNFLISVNHVLYSQINSLGDAVLIIVEEPYRDWNSHYFAT